MSSVLIEIDLLRTRFNRLRKGQTFLKLEDAIDVSRVILSHFATGGRVGVESLVKIEDWCNIQERTHGHP